MRRTIDGDLERWRADPGRRVLPIRGARQVSKTLSVRTPGSRFENFVEITFEKMIKARNLFDGDLDAPELLVLAGLVYKVHHSAARGIPLSAQIDERKFKTILFDIGIHQRVLGLDLSAENFSTCERIDIMPLYAAGRIPAVAAGASKPPT